MSFYYCFNYEMNEAADFVPLKSDVLLGLNSRIDDRTAQIIINESHKCTGKDLCGIAYMQFNFKIQILVFSEKFRRR